MTPFGHLFILAGAWLVTIGALAKYNPPSRVSHFVPAGLVSVIAWGAAWWGFG